MTIPSSPTDISISRSLREVYFNRNPNYEINDHEYTIDSGSNWIDCISEVISVPNGLYKTSTIQVRVKALNGDSASLPLINSLPFWSEKVVKIANPLMLKVCNMAGQSNMEGVTNGENVPPVPVGFDFYGGELKTFENTNQNHVNTMAPCLANAIAENSDFAIVTAFTSVGGTSLQNIPEIVAGNWSSEGLLRYESADYLAECIDYINTSIIYDIESVNVLFNQGEADGGAYDLGYNSTKQGYKNEFASMVNYFSEAISMDNCYIIRLGKTVSTPESEGFNLIRDAQDELGEELDNTSVAFKKAIDFPDIGLMTDDVHWQQTGQNYSGTETGFFMLGLEYNNIDVITTEVFHNNYLLNYYKFDDVGKNSVIGGADLLFNGSAETGTTDALWTYGENLTLDGTNGYASIAQTPVNLTAFSVSFKLRLGTINYSNRCLFGDSSLKGGVGFYGINLILGAELSIGMMNGTTVTSGRFFNSSFSPASIENDEKYHSVLVTYGDYGGTNYLRLYVDGVIYLDEIVTGFVLNPDGSEFGIGANGDNGWSDYAHYDNELSMDHFRFSNVAYTQQDAISLTNEISFYEVANFPVTPDAPVITNEDNNLNLFEFTAAGDVEMRLNGGEWFDQTSPCDFGNVDLPIGAIEIRVKAEGVNPASEIVTNTKAFTAADEANLCELSFYMLDMTGASNSIVQIRLAAKTARYKNNALVCSETKKLTPDPTTGKVSVNLVQSEGIDGDGYYQLKANDTVYRFKVPTQDIATLSDLTLEPIEKYRRW